MYDRALVGVSQLQLEQSDLNFFEYFGDLLYVLARLVDMDEQEDNARLFSQVRGLFCDGNTSLILGRAASEQLEKLGKGLIMQVSILGKDLRPLLTISEEDLIF